MQRMSQYRVTTVAAGKAFIHIDILYTSSHKLSIQNFNSTRLKAGWFTKKSEYCQRFCRYADSDVLEFNMFLEVLQSSRKKLRRQLGKSIPLYEGQYSQTCWKGLLRKQRVRELILSTLCDLKVIFTWNIF